MKTKGKGLFIACMALSAALLFGGCANHGGLDPKEPVTLSLWHNFGGQMQSTMDELVDEFNGGVGREKGIIINVTSISGSSAMQEKLTMIARGDPGAPEMPDIATCYPATATLMKNAGRIADMGAYFSAEELSGYLPRFIEEGRLSGGLYVLPFAKSTEALFLNQTLYDRFLAESGESCDLSTFDGIAAAARAYYEWTDGLTADIQNDGKSFYAADSLFNLAQVGMAQLGGSLIEGEALSLKSESFKRIWETWYECAVKGGAAIYEGYSSDLSKTGDIICSTGSTAGILFYGDRINYPDNTTEKVEFTVLPYPVFAGGEAIAIQRGSGMVVASGDARKELAAAEFIKWFTAPEQNMRFVASTGYLPVTNSAFESSMEGEIAANENVNIQKLLRTAVEVYETYDFYVAPAFDSFNDLGDGYEAKLIAMAAEAREEYIALKGQLGEQAAYEQATQGDLDRFIAEMEG